MGSRRLPRRLRNVKVVAKRVARNVGCRKDAYRAGLGARRRTVGLDTSRPNEVRRIAMGPRSPAAASRPGLPAK